MWLSARIAINIADPQDRRSRCAGPDGFDRRGKCLHVAKVDTGSTCAECDVFDGQIKYAGGQSRSARMPAVFSVYSPSCAMPAPLLEPACALLTSRIAASD